jgi:K+-sensing histidine kinase KdpD
LKGAVLDEKYAVYLQMMNESVKRLEKFSLQALLITQLRTGKYVRDIRAVWIDSEFQKALIEFEDHLAPKNLKIQCHISAATCHIDATLLQHLIYSLIENAIYYCNPDGMIDISGRSNPGNRYVITVCHSGQEFPEAILLNPLTIFSEENFIDGCPHLFLYTIRLIINNIQGKLLLRNLPGKGAEVEIDLLTVGQEQETEVTVNDLGNWIT